ncbi:hypothetical protein Tco_0868064 [Tanacetum coccineum]
MLSSLSSLILPIRKRYQVTSELVADIENESSDSNAKKEGSEDEGNGLEDEGYGFEDECPGSEEEDDKVAPEGQQEAALVVDIAADEPLRLGYGALRHHELALGEGSFFTSFTIIPSSSITITSPVTTPAATIAVDEDKFLEVGAQLELYGSILHDHTSLEQEQERAIVTFGALWRLVLALEAWAGHVDARRAEMSHARYDDYRLINDLLVQNTMMQRELQELRDRVTILEQERSCREQ